MGAIRTPHVLIAVGIAAGLAFLFFANPAETRFFPVCVFHYITGFDCPGCGTARALHAALHGRFAEAFGYNAALPFVIAVLLSCMAFPRVTGNHVFATTVLLASLAWGIWRNLT